MKVRLTVEDDVAVITLDHPPLNIYDLEMRDALVEALGAVADHPDARALLLRAEGRNFSAGADLSEFGTAPTIIEARRIRGDRDPWVPLWELPQPTVVALKGHALGAGLEMALLCDFRLADVGTRPSLPETGLGMLPSAGGTQSLLRTLGPARARPLVLTGVTFDPALVARIVDDAEDVDIAAAAVARRLAALPVAAARAAKRAARAALDLPLGEGLHTEKALARSVRAGQAGGAL